jgi:VWFA-related protein
MIRRYLLVGLLLTLTVHGQAPGLVSDKPPIRVTTRMVSVSVVVHRGGGSATGLTKDDFQVFDNGKEQRIAAFSGGTPSLGTTGVGTTGVGSGSIPAPGAAKPSPAVFSNRTDKGPPGITIILLDALNTPPNELSSAKDQVIRCLNQLEGNNAIALYALGGRLLVLHDFTQNTAHLRQAVEDYQAGKLPFFDLNPASSGLGQNGGMGGMPFGQMAANADTELSAAYLKMLLQLTMGALEAIARHVQPIPGRKNLVWISAGFSINIPVVGGSESYHGEANSLARVLTDADLAVYPVHTGGLAGANLGTSVSGRRARGAVNSAPIKPASMALLADQTGGKAYYGTNDLGAAVQHAIADAESAYSLGFYPAEENLDGKFHEIRVHLKARGADLRYRRGYFATPDPKPTLEQRQSELNKAVSSPFESTGIAMKVRLDPADQPKPGSFRLVVGIDLNSLTLATKGDHRVGGAQMMLVQQSADGRRLQGTDETIRLDLAPDEFDRMTKDGLVLVKYVEPAAGVFQFRVYVLDTNSGALGTVYVPVGRN